MKKKMCGFLAGLLCFLMICTPVFAEGNDDLMAKLKESAQRIKDMSSQLEERLRVMYMYGNDGYLQVLFSSNNFTDFIARADMMKNVMQADKDAVTALENTKKELEEKNAGLEADKAAAEQAKAVQNEAKEQQNQLLAKNRITLRPLISAAPLPDVSTRLRANGPTIRALT